MGQETCINNCLYKRKHDRDRGNQCSNVLAEAEKPKVRSEKVMALEKVPRVCVRPAVWGGQEQRGSVGQTALKYKYQLTSKYKSLHATMGEKALSEELLEKGGQLPGQRGQSA